MSDREAGDVCAANRTGRGLLFRSFVESFPSRSEHSNLNHKLSFNNSIWHPAQTKHPQRYACPKTGTLPLNRPLPTPGLTV